MELVVAVIALALVAAVALGWRLASSRLDSAGAIERAVQMAVEVAGSRLDQTVASSRNELDLRGTAIDRQVDGLTAELEHLRRSVVELHRSSSAQNSSLVTGLAQVAQTSSEVAAITDDLRAALASPKRRGQWGERMAVDVLRAAGFKEGVNFRTQRATASGSIPDVTFLLPGDLELRMDVKFPIDNYLRAGEATTPAEEQAASKAFVRDVRARVKELSGRQYVDPSVSTRCVILFIPNEAVYAALHELDPEIVDIAISRQVVLASPSTLFGVLAVIRQAVDHFRLERTSDEILQCLGSVTEQWSRFTEDLDKLEKQFATVGKTLADVQGVRRRMIEQQFDRVEALRDADPALPPGEAFAARRSAGDVREFPGAGGVAAS